MNMVNRMQNETNLNDLFSTLDADLQALSHIRCQHTGKPLGTIPYAQLQTLVQIHGTDNARIILEYTRKGYAPEWTWNNAEGLDRLYVYQPKEYFIYVVSLLLQNSFEDKCHGWDAVQIIDVELLKPIAELCKRILAMINPHDLRGKIKNLRNNTLKGICRNLEMIAIFQLELARLLDRLIENQKLLDEMEIVGWKVFAKQKQVKPLTELEQKVQNDFKAMNFELIPGKSASKVEIIVGTKYSKSANKPKRIKFEGKALINQPFAGLKFNTGGGQNAK